MTLKTFNYVNLYLTQFHPTKQTVKINQFQIMYSRCVSMNNDIKSYFFNLNNIELIVIGKEHDYKASKLSDHRTADQSESSDPNSIQ